MPTAQNDTTTQDVKDDGLATKLKSALEGMLPDMIGKYVGEKVNEYAKEKGLDKIDMKYGVTPLTPDGDKMTKGQASTKFLTALVAKDMAYLANLNLKTLTGIVDSAGGFVVPEELAAMVDEIKLNVGLIRKLARRMPMNSLAMNVPILDNDVVVTWPGQATAGTASDFSLAQVHLECKTMSGLTAMANELMQDANINVVNFIADRFAQAMAKEEDSQGLVGTGLPFTGALNHTLINEVQMASGNTTFASASLRNFEKMIATLEETILAGCVFIFHRSVFADIKSIQENSQSIIQTWNPQVDGTVGGGLLMPAGKLCGYPVFTSSRMPSSTAVSTRFGLFGNFNYLYFGDRQASSMATSPDATIGGLSMFEANCTGVRMTERIALEVGLPAAFCALKTAAS